MVHPNLRDQHVALERSDQPYGGTSPDIQRAWDSFSEGERAAYNFGYSVAHDRASKSSAEASERQELRTLRELRKVVLALVEREPF